MATNRLRYAYNTNGCANHRLKDAVALISDAGYDGIALTLDWQHLDPYAPDWRDQSHRLADELLRRDLGCVIETGARFLLNPRLKHEPTLINPTVGGRRKRLDFLKRAVDVAAILRAEAVSLWAGVQQDRVTNAEARQWLVEGITELCAYADDRKVTLALEPEPGMAIETNADYQSLKQALPKAARSSLRLALDVGHVWVTGEMWPEEAVRMFQPELGTVAIEGMERGVHTHLPITEGDMEIPPILSALREIQFARLVCVELSRESHRAHRAIPETLSILQALEADLQ